MTGAPRVPPHDLDAEESLLGAMFLSAGAVDVALDTGIDVSDFYKPAHGVIFEAISTLHRDGRGVDTVTVAGLLTDTGELERIGGKATLAKLEARTPASANAPAYALRVRTLAHRRRVIEAAGALQDAAMGDAPADELDALVLSMSGRVRATRPLPRPPSTLGELFDDADDVYDWLVPGLIERGDRVVLSGAEGQGKSTLLRQVAVAAAAGVHPFTFEPIGPLRVLVVDLENSVRQLRREFAKALGPLDEPVRAALLSIFFIESHAEGLVLDVARDPDGDRGWLEATIAGCSPDLVVVGPIYKMIAGDATEELPNRELVKWIDRLRGRYGFAVLLEAHTPHDAKRPYGWSGWKRWPEFGVHLDEDGTLSHWRGQRDERAWPARLLRVDRNGSGNGWLFTPAVPAVPEQHVDPHEDAIAQAGVDALRVMRQADKRLSRVEIVERTGRRKASVVAAIARLRDKGAFIVTTETRSDPTGRTYTVELFEIDPNGPFVGDETSRSRNRRPPTPGPAGTAGPQGGRPDEPQPTSSTPNLDRVLRERAQR